MQLMCALECVFQIKKLMHELDVWIHMTLCFMNSLSLGCMGKIWVLSVMVTGDAKFLWKLNIEGVLQFPVSSFANLDYTHLFIGR